MSHQTGIKANEKLKKFFSSYLDLNVRVFKVSIENEELILSHFEKVTGSWQEDFDKLVPPLVSPAQPAYILYRLDTKNETTGYDWLLISWSPDESPVRQKMLFASTKATLKQEFGSGQIKEEYHATSEDDVSLKSLKRHRLAVMSPAPLTTREEELAELRKSETTGLTEISVDSRSQTLSGVSFPLLPDALSAVQRLSNKEVNYAQFKIDVPPKNSEFHSRSVPIIKTTLETDHNSNTVELKVTIPMPEHSLSVACIIATSEELRPFDDSSNFPYHNEQAVSLDLDQEFHNMKSLCISHADPFILSSENPDFQAICVDGTVNHNSDSNSEESNILSNSDLVLAEVTASNSSVYDFVSCTKEGSSESFSSPKSRNTVTKNLKRKPEENLGYEPKMSKKPKDVASFIELSGEALCKNTESISKNDSSPSSIKGSISKLNTYFKKLAVENNNIDCEQAMPILGSVLKEILILKGKNACLPGATHKALLKALLPYINTDTLLDEKQNFAPKYIYELIMLSAKAVFIILSSYSKELLYDEFTVSQMALFVFNNFFNSLLPVIQKSNRKSDPLSEINFNKTFGNNSFRNLLNRFEEIISLFSKRADIVSESDDAFSKLASVCISSFFTVNILSLQHSCLNLITSFFTLFEEKRDLILDHAVSTIALLNSDTNFIAKLFLVSNSDTKIQFLTAALLKFVCGTANYLKSAAGSETLRKLYLVKSSQTSKLFHNFFNKMICNSVMNNNFKSVLENVIVDLLKIRCQPEWPSTNFLFRYLYRLIVFYLSDKNKDKHVRGVCFDYLAILLPAFRQDFVLRPSILNSLAKIVSTKSHYSAFSDKADEVSIIISDSVCCLKLVIQLLASSKNSKFLRNSTQFFCILLIEEMLSNIKKFGKKTLKVESDKQCNALFTFIHQIVQYLNDSESFSANSKPALSNPDDEELVKTLCRYLSSSNLFASHSEKLLKHVIARVCEDSKYQIQLKAIKCLLSVIEIDTSLLCFSYVELAINRLVTHRSVSIREKVINFLSNYIFTNESFFEKYFPVISERILDVSASVRKAALSSLCKLCLIKPDYPQISGIFIKILRRLNDESPIVKVIIDFFQLKWINVLGKSSSDSSLPITLEILSILKLAQDTDVIDNFVKLFKTLVNSSDSELVETSLRAYKKITQCVLNHILKKKALDIDSTVNSYKLLLMIMLAKSEVAAVLTPILYPHLHLKLVADENSVILSFVLQLLEQMFLSCQSYFQNDGKKKNLSTQFGKLINVANWKNTIKSVCCLSLISKINNDFSQVVQIFITYHQLLLSPDSNSFTKNISVQIVDEKEHIFTRIMIVLGALIKHVNFSRIQTPNFDPSIVKVTAQQIINLLINDSKPRLSVLKAFSLISSRFSSAILMERVVSVFTAILQHTDHSIQLKIHVLKIINSYLEENNLRSRVLNDNWSKISKREDLKMMNDVSAGKPNVVAQRYLPSILQCYLTKDKCLRVTTVQTLLTITNFSLLHPSNFLHYTTCMLADPEPSIAVAAFNTLVDVQTKNASLIQPCCLKGILLSVELLQIISPDEVFRGFILTGNIPSSRFFKLNEVLQVKDRHAIVSTLVNQFIANDDGEVKLNVLLYLADNLAYFPYKEVHDVFLVLFQINTIICNTAVPFFQKMQYEFIKDIRREQMTVSDETNSKSTNVKWKSQKKIADLTLNQFSCTCETGFAFILLLQLWHFLKLYYHISDKYIHQHLSESSLKVKRPANRNSKVKLFNPESVIHYLKSKFSEPSENKENFNGTQLISILKCLNSEFEDLSSKIMTENSNDP